MLAAPAAGAQGGCASWAGDAVDGMALRAGEHQASLSVQLAAPVTEPLPGPALDSEGLRRAAHTASTSARRARRSILHQFNLWQASAIL